MPSRYQDTVVALVKGGTPFVDVEEFIEAQDISEDGKSALWLLAWAETPGIDRAAETRKLLALIDAG